jgi:hypothetical protein
MAENMKLKSITIVAGLLIAQSAYALSQCDVKECGPNPFYILFVGFSQVCSETYPERSSNYKTALAKMVAENPKAYAKVDADVEFQIKLSELQREARRLPIGELETECTRLLSNARGRQ